ncbi:MAG: thiamine phosphate synthase [Balneolales bacterium]
MKKADKIAGGIYLVIDPSIKKSLLLMKVKAALAGGAGILQIWNHWPGSFDVSAKTDTIEAVMRLADEFDIPVLINEEWSLLKHTRLDGVHFDSIPDNYPKLKSEIKREFIAGITCGNDTDVLYWAEQNKLDYVSFCSMFPSRSAINCEIVSPATVRKAKEITKMPIFLSGGITEDNMGSLKELDFDGIAVISGILNAASPERSVHGYNQALNSIKKTI